MNARRRDIGTPHANIAAIQILSPRKCRNNGMTAAAVGTDGAGVNVETEC